MLFFAFLLLFEGLEPGGKGAQEPHSISMIGDIFSGYFSNNAFYLTESKSFQISDSLFSDFTRNCINIVDSRQDIDCGIQSTVFNHFDSPYRGGAIFIANTGELTLAKVCAANCQNTEKILAGAFLFSVYHSTTSSTLLSLSNCPGYDKKSMASLCFGANIVHLVNANSSHGSAVCFAFDLKQKCDISYVTISSNVLEGKAIDACLLTSRSHVQSVNFLNNTVHKSENDAVSIFSVEWRVSDYENAMSGCSFIDNNAQYIIYSIKGAALNVASTYFDNGVIYSGIFVTDLVSSEQTILQMHFATMNLCEADLSFLENSGFPFNDYESENDQDHNKGQQEQEDDPFMENVLISVISFLSVVGVVLVVIAVYSLIKKARRIRIANGYDSEDTEDILSETTSSTKSNIENENQKQCIDDDSSDISISTIDTDTQ